jgi:uncharacterized protein (UPF0333 family)
MEQVKIVHNDKGQTAVEYIFLLAVIVTIVTSLLSVIKRRYLGDISRCTPSSTQLLCKLNAIIADNGQQKKFQYYRFNK